MINSNITFQQAYQLQQNGQSVEALRLYSKILKCSPNHLGALSMFGMLSVERSNYLEGISSLEKSLKLDPMQYWAINALGVAYLNLDQYSIAVKCFLNAIRIKIDYADAYFNLGKTYRKLKKFNESIAAYTNCLNYKRFYADAYLNRGNVYLEDLSCPIIALEDFDQYIKLKPDSPYGYSNMGNALMRLKNYPEALKSYDLALNYNPDYPEVYFHKGEILSELGQYEDALICFSTAYKLKPSFDYLLSHIIRIKLVLCDWNGIEPLIKSARKGLNELRGTILPLVLMSISDSLDFNQKTAKILSKLEHEIKMEPLEEIPKSYSHSKIRIGYFSADYNNHPVMQVSKDIYRHHNKDLFEIYAFSFGPEDFSGYRREIISYFDKFIDVSDLSDLDVAKLSREMEIDIAVNLNGYTKNERTKIFAYRAAPVQINYLGFPGTMGVDYMDFIIADEFVIPRSSQNYYDEKVLYLPNTFFPNTEIAVFPTNQKNPDKFGLPQDSFIFCTFCNVSKFTPEIFSLWMSILMEVPNSVLWFTKSNEIAEENLYKEAAK
jgi:predicted O-linked N-acetylglucosamine transferase (SPINDLY family)